MLRLPDAWLWDSWFARDNGVHHVFYLQASRALHDPGRRHTRASIGHAVSTDLRAWTRLPDALVHPDPPAFDQTATWTGSVVQGHDERWYLFYTGVRREGRALRQQIGVATSTDLLTWHRHGDGPVTVADRRWYARLGDSPAPWQDEHWRDPWVFADPGGDGWHMLITARANHGPDDDRGVIGHARSADLLGWEVQPPLSAPGSGFGQLEVPQVETVQGQSVLIFSCLRSELAAARQTDGVTGGTWALATDSLIGPFDLTAATPLTDDQLYSGRLVQGHDGEWSLLAFLGRGADDAFVGELSDPMPVAWQGPPAPHPRRLTLMSPGGDPSDPAHGAAHWVGD